MTGNKLYRRPGFTLIELLITAAIFSIVFLIATSVFINVQTTQRGIAGRQRVVADGRYILEAMARTVRLGQVDYLYYRDPNTDCSVTNPASTCASDAISLTQAQPILAVRDQTGRQTCFSASGGVLQSVTGRSDCFATAAASEIITLTPEDIRVLDFHVIITPRSDPYLGVRTHDQLDCRNPAGLTADGACPCVQGNIVPEIDLLNCLPDQRCVLPPNETQAICANVNRQPTVTLVLSTENVNQSTGEQSDITLQTTVTSRLQRR